jgi:lipoprotein-anchoring transpeptidase ErfK/SrfK
MKTEDTMNPIIHARGHLARLVALATLGVAALASSASAANLDPEAAAVTATTTRTSPPPAAPPAGTNFAATSSTATPGNTYDTYGVDTSAAEPLRLVVNIPAYRVEAFLGDQPVASWPVTVGKRNEPTFPGHYEIDSVIWNPWWHPPANRRPKEKVTPPGPRNPMGKAKLQLRGLYYIHGTAKEDEIGRPLSRGCVRMRNEDVVTLARLVHQHAGPPMAAEELEKLLASPRWTRRVALARPVPVDIVYHVVEVRDGELQVFPDIYRREATPLAELALTALQRAGYDAADFDRAAVEQALAAGGEEALTVPVAALRPGAEATPEPAVAAIAAEAAWQTDAGLTAGGGQHAPN